MAKDQLPLPPSSFLLSVERPGRTSVNLSIKGVASATWITYSLLAMSRPSSRGLHEGGLLQQLLDSDVRLVINLQEHGEHPLCGEPLAKDSGLAYCPGDLEKAGIQVVHGGWRDFGVPSVAHIDWLIDQIEANAAKEYKTAAHCHAGHGRTGLLMACALVRCKSFEPITAVTYLRERRRGSLQTRKQVQFVFDYARAKGLSDTQPPPGMIPKRCPGCSSRGSRVAPIPPPAQDRADEGHPYLNEP